MQKHRDGTVVVSATDLVGFLACDHLATLELERIAGLREKPERYDPELELLQERGDRHEHDHLERLRAAGRTIVEIPPELRSARTPDELRAAATATRAAMERRRRRRLPGDLLRRSLAWPRRLPDPGRTSEPTGCLELRRRRHEARPPRQGERAHPDVRLRRPARRGPGGAARKPSPSSPATAVATTTASPTSPPSTAWSRPASRPACSATRPRRRPTPTRSTTAASAAGGSTCVARREADDHLSLVAGMTRTATERLVDGGIRTLARLGETAPVGPASRT